MLGAEPAVRFTRPEISVASAGIGQRGRVHHFKNAIKMHASQLCRSLQRCGVKNFGAVNLIKRVGFVALPERRAISVARGRIGVHARAFDLSSDTWAEIKAIQADALRKVGSMACVPHRRALARCRDCAHALLTHCPASGRAGARCPASVVELCGDCATAPLRWHRVLRLVWQQSC